MPLDLSKERAKKRQFLIDAGFENGKWAFEKTDIERRQELAELGESDIIISHCPPTGLQNGYYDKQGCCAELRDYILKYQPKYCFCGHVHQLNGVHKIGETIVVVSCNTMRVFDIGS